jgi:hypothetical protein
VLSAAEVSAQFAASGLGRPPAPGSPAAAGGVNQATVSWTAPAGADPVVTGYLVTALKAGAAANAVSVPASATSTTVTGLAGSTSYTFEIQALNEYGGGATATTAAVTVTGTPSTYASTVLSEDPSVFYRLADSDLGAMADSSGNGATGVYNRSVATLGEAGPLANDNATAVAANDAGETAEGNPSALPLYAAPRTLEGWIDTTSTGEEFVAGYGSTNADEGFALAVQPDDVYVSGYGDDLSFTSPSVLNDGQWHFIVVTTNGSSATAYVDGVNLGTQTFPHALDTLPAPQGFLVGADAEGCCGYFEGELADVAVFPSALTSTEVSAQFGASGLGRPPAPGSPAAVGGENQATVSWTAPSGSDPAVTGYLVTAYKGSAGANAVSVPASVTSTTVTGLAGSTSYTFKVEALNEYGAGAAATTAAVTTTGPASTYASTVLASDPSVFYRLGDSDPSAMADSSGNGATGVYDQTSTTLGEPEPLANDPSTSVEDNSDGPAGQGNPSTLPLYAQPRTLEGWIHTTSTGEEWLAGYGTDSTGQGFAAAVEPDDVVASGYNDDLTFPSSAALNDGQWHFIVVTTNGASATAYVDGVSLGTQNFPQGLDTLPAPPGFVVGADAQGCCGYFNGDLADVAVFPSALTAAGVTAQFAASGLGRPPAPTKPKATAGANQVTVSWTAPSEADPAVSGYLVTALAAGAPANAVSVPASTTSTILTGLAGATSYTFEIEALNEYGAGAAATTAAVTTTGTASTYASTVLSFGPSLFYRLGDSDPAAMADSSGNGATGFYNSSAATLGQAGPLANDPSTAIEDDGDGLAAEANPSTLPLYAQPRTLEGWINTTSSGEELLAGYGTTSSGEGFAVAVEPEEVVASGFGDDLSFTSSSRLDDGQWHFIVVTTNGSSATAYVDGVSLGTQTFPHSLDTLPALPGFLVGADAQGCCGYFDGDLADVALFPTALTAADVTAQFAASGLGRPPAPTDAKATKGANQATVSWTAPSASDPAVTGYLVTALEAGTPANSVSVPASSTSTIVTGLAGKKSYTFEVEALNEYGAGAAGTTAAVTTTGTASTYASTVLSLGPSAFYRLGDSDPAAMADSSGNGATGFYNPSSTLGQAGPLANDPSTAIEDNGDGPAAEANPSTLPLYAQPRTLEGWINTTYGGEVLLAGYGTQNTGEGFAVAVEPDDVVASGYGDDLSFTSSTALNNGEWHLIVVTTNGVSATAYVDGVSLGTQTFPQTLDTLPAPQGFLVGAGVQGCCGYYVGDLADVAVFPSALTAAQVTSEESAATAGHLRLHTLPMASAGPMMTGSDTPVRYGRLEYLVGQAVAGSRRSEITRTRSSTARTRVNGVRP